MEPTMTHERIEQIWGIIAEQKLTLDEHRNEIKKLNTELAQWKVDYYELESDYNNIVRPTI